jgi:MFS family permease
MMPQTVTVTFMLVWLINHRGWSVAAAGGLVTLSQLLGAVGRIAVGRWSDRVGSRLRPVRAIAIAAAVTMFLLALTDSTDSGYVVLLMVAVSVIAVLDNGLEATAITQVAGPFWTGRALGVQNTTQRLMAAAGAPLFGVLIMAAEYPAAWALCGLFPLAAAPLVPSRKIPSADGPIRRDQSPEVKSMSSSVSPAAGTWARSGSRGRSAAVLGLTDDDLARPVEQAVG